MPVPPAPAPYGPPASYGAVAPHAPVAPVVPRQSGVGIAGFVVGLVSLFLPLIVGVIGALIGLGLSIGGMVQTGRRKGLAIAGLVISIVALILII